MKIYTKILLTTLPLLLISLLIAVGTTYYFSHDALTCLARTWLGSRLTSAMRAAEERQHMLRAYGLESATANIKQANTDAGAAMLAIRIGEQGHISVIDSHGIIIVHPDPSLVGIDVSRTAWFPELEREQKGEISYTLQNVDYLAVYNYFQPWQWHILASDSKSEVYGAANRIVPYLFLLLTCGSSLLALTLAFLIRRLTAPLRILEMGAKQIGRGNLDTRVTVGTRDELGGLADVFNNMAAQLQGTLTELKYSEEHFRSLIENSSDIIMILDREGNIRYASPSIERLHGYGQEDLIGKDIFDLIHPEDGANLKALLSQRILIPGVSPYAEFRVRNKDGSWCFVEAGFNNLLHDPIVGGLVVNSRDITERKRAEEALRDSERRLSDIIDFLPDPTFAIDLSGKVAAWNRAIEVMTGVSAEYMLGKGDYEYALPFYGARRPILIDLVFGSDEVIQEKYHLIKREGGALLGQADVPVKGGQARILLGKAGPLSDSKGNTVGAIETIRDLTEHVRMEEELHKKQKLESVGILAGGIAHDFNNILSVILGNINLVQMYAQPDPLGTAYLDDAEKAILQAKDLTKKFLTFSMGGEPRKNLVSFRRLITDAVNLALTGSNIRYEYSFCEQPDCSGLVDVDQDQMSQAIYNIVVNAREAMPDGGVVKISTECLEAGAVHAQTGVPVKERRYIKLSIKDEGTGIPEENLEKLFDPYFSTKQRGVQKGMGLGLAIAQSVVTRHEGYISVESKAKTEPGATFFIYLPVISEDKKILPIQQPVPVKTSISGGGRILLMDDEEMLVTMAAKMLNHLGYEVVVAKDGTRAIERFIEAVGSGKPFDVVILDLTIKGGLGGKEVIGKLMEIDPLVNAIVSSGYSNDPVMAAFQAYGFRGALPKPYQMRELTEVLHRVLNFDG